MPADFWDGTPGHVPGNVSPSNPAPIWVASGPLPEIGSFLGRQWDPRYASLAIQSWFAIRFGDNVARKVVTDAMDVAWGARPSLISELAELQELIEFRPGVMSEALSQRGNLAGYFCAMIGVHARSHPATFLLASVAETVGLFVAMYYKARYGRPRPSRVSPLLRPPIAVPGHAAFPSGHATQSFLIAKMLSEALPTAVKTPLSDAQSQIPPAAATTLAGGGPLYRLAERIARNREVMGLHYPTDTLAGMLLADHAKTMLVNTFTDLKDTTKFNDSSSAPVITTGMGVPYDLMAKVSAEWTNDAP